MESLRSIKFQQTAVFDYVATVLSAFFVSWLTSIPVTLVTILLFLFSIPLHFQFDVRTQTNDYLRSHFGFVFLK